MKSLKNSWSNEVGRTSRCDMTYDHQITVDTYYTFLDHLLDENNNHWVLIKNDNNENELIPLECFYLDIDDKRF